VTVYLKNGNVYDGIFYTATPFTDTKYEIVLKQVIPHSRANSDSSSFPKGCTLQVPFKDVQRVHVEDVRMSNNGGTGPQSGLAGSKRGGQRFVTDSQLGNEVWRQWNMS